MCPSDVAPTPPPYRPGASGQPEGAPETPRRSVPIGWIVLIVAGGLVSLIALAPLVGGSGLLWVDATKKDREGFFTTPSERLETTTYAITSSKVDLGADPTGRRARVDLGELATIRIDVRSTDESNTFVGIGPAHEVNRYLSDVSHAEVEHLRFDPFAVDYRYHQGGAPRTAPGDAKFWAASVEGPGAQRLEWRPQSGNWAVVIMNADGSAGVSVQTSLGASSPWVFRVGLILVVAGAVGMLIGVTLLVAGILGLTRGSDLELTTAAGPGRRPVRLQGRLDEPLSRWLWLVKWLLLIPHFIVLAVLWIAFVLVTVVAFFAILFTERYPRSLFGFNVGVLRWTWRVTYYGYSALGTDRYPPFSLGEEPDYPATLSVTYPERLSRGLVLVKWWLLAIPHYLILTLLEGGGTWRVGRGGWWVARYPAGGFIGLLVFFAAVALLFTGRYPRGLHDLVVGLNRWVYRVIVYVALMRDDYPPFRLDQGGAEPGPDQVPPTGTPPHGEALVPGPEQPGPRPEPASTGTTH